MRLCRVKAEGQGFYHAMSRTVHGVVIFDTSGKRCDNAEQFRSRMWALAAFCGVRVLDYSLMSNHFHLVFVHLRGLDALEAMMEPATNY
jgi:hypothetical protein